MRRLPGRDARVQQAVEGISRVRLEQSVRTLATFPTRHTLSGPRGADAAALWLERTLRGYGGRLDVRRDRWIQPRGNRLPEPAELTNVVAILPGTETPERLLVVSGHYDSRVTDVLDTKGTAPGANDDASGVAVVLECARVLAEQRFPATVVFAAVTGEEQGLYGATRLAQTLAAAQKTVVAMLTNDIVGNSRGQDGRRDDRRVRVFSAGWDPSLTPAEMARRRAWGTDTETPSRILGRAIADSARRHVRRFAISLVLRPDRYGRGGDHSAFLTAGYAAAVRLTEPNEDWRHQHQDLRTENGVRYGDLPEFVDFPYLTRVAQVNIAALTELAVAPPAPSRVTLKGDLDPNTTLSWDVPARAAACEAVLPLSKDDHLFAVRAIGEGGAHSLPTVPVAGR